MIAEFSPQEILRIAIKVEETGQKLYEVLEKRANDKEFKDVWTYLKEQEIIHRDIFKKMLDKVNDYIVDDFNPGEYSSYIRAIAANYIFTQKLIEENLKTLPSSDAEALDFGIFIEKESILTYSAFKEYIKTDKQIVLDKIIDEEKKHLVRLSSLKKIKQSS